MENETYEYIVSLKERNCHFLNDRQQKVLILKTVESKTFSDIAKIIGRSKNQVSFIFERALSLVKLYLIKPNQDMLICDTLLSKRIKNACEFSGIKFVKELHQFPYDKLCKARNLGRKSVNEIQEYLKNFGFSLDFHTREHHFDFIKSFIEDLPYDKIIELLNILLDYRDKNLDRFNRAVGKDNYRP